jgi:hypothetical protein
MCGRDIESNSELRVHLLTLHRISLIDYYRYYPNATKYCNKCKRELPITKFYVDRCKTSGYRTRCITCIRPKGEKHECPLCHRMLQFSGMIAHLKRDHGIRPIDAYRWYLKGRRCPKCKTVKPLKEFYRLKNGGYFAYCKKCNHDRVKRYRLKTRSSSKEFQLTP